ncbi:MAG: S-methyl-5-thioribose-1-phosphate isomerase [Pseudoxanthomonas sp.]|nr:S-methyl-5-thioribose-1-phosphate isomerase [Pseudoxanthomonas sp.]
MTPTADPHDTLRPIAWQGDHLRLLDQRRLPGEVVHLACRGVDEVAAAIHDLAVRGAPAIGIAGAWGMVLAASQALSRGETGVDALEAPARTLIAARPTAVNLAWAVTRMLQAARAAGVIDPTALAAQARAIEAEDLAANRRMGELGAGLIAPGSGVLTHCNTGSLATAGFGTALGVIRSAWSAGRLSAVYASETRPWLQGARLTVWELAQDRIPATLLVDSAAAHLMAGGAVRWLVVGADRIAANGDTANKIGTLQLAIAARHFGVKVMVVAPSSTVDLSIADGSAIEIELRDEAEVTRFGGQATAAAGVRAWNPVFDVTPAGLIDAIVTERGVVERPQPGDLAALLVATS